MKQCVCYVALGEHKEAAAVLESVPERHRSPEAASMPTALAEAAQLRGAGGAADATRPWVRPWLRSLELAAGLNHGAAVEALATALGHFKGGGAPVVLLLAAARWKARLQGHGEAREAFEAYRAASPAAIAGLDCYARVLAELGDRARLAALALDARRPEGWTVLAVYHALLAEDGGGDVGLAHRGLRLCDKAAACGGAMLEGQQQLELLLARARLAVMTEGNDTAALHYREATMIDQEPAAASGLVQPLVAAGSTRDALYVAKDHQRKLH